MKFLILLLSIGLVLAQEKTTAEADAVSVPPTTESSGRQECNGEGQLVFRIGCTETCRRRFKFGEFPIFTFVPVGAPCKATSNSEQNDGVCQVSSYSAAFGVCSQN